MTQKQKTKMQWIQQETRIDRRATVKYARLVSTVNRTWAGGSGDCFGLVNDQVLHTRKAWMNFRVLFLGE